MNSSSLASKLLLIFRAVHRECVSTNSPIPSDMNQFVQKLTDAANQANNPPITATQAAYLSSKKTGAAICRKFLLMHSTGQGQVFDRRPLELYLLLHNETDPLLVIPNDLQAQNQRIQNIKNTRRNVVPKKLLESISSRELKHKVLTAGRNAIHLTAFFSLLFQLLEKSCDASLTASHEYEVKEQHYKPLVGVLHAV